MINYLEKKFSEYSKNRILMPNKKSWKIHDLVKDIKLTKKQLSNIVIEINNDNKIVRYLVLPFHRFSSNYYTIFLENKSYTLGELLNLIYDFYNNKVLNYHDLKSLNSDDVYDYIDDACIELKNNPDSIIHPINIMGDKTYFEYICIDEDNVGDIQYILCLGS